MRVPARLTPLVYGGLLAACLVAASACGSTTPQGSEQSQSPTSPEASALVSAAPMASESCQPRHDFDTVSEGTLTALLTAYPPYGFVQDGQAAGLDGELIRLIAEMECLTLDVKDADVAGIVDQIRTGRADISGGDWWRSKDRQEIVAMSDPVYVDGMAVISRDGSSSIDQLAGKSVGDVQGIIWNPELKEVLGADYRLYKTLDDVIKDLEIGRIDAAITTPGAGAYYLESKGLDGFRIEVLQPDDRVPSSLNPPQAGLMVSLDNPTLLAAINENLEELRTDGTLEKLAEKYGFPADVLNTGAPTFS